MIYKTNGGDEGMSMKAGGLEPCLSEQAMVREQDKVND